MGNNKSRETSSYSRQSSDIIQPHSALLDIVLTELVYCSDTIKVFNSYNINVKEAPNVHILNNGFFIKQNKQLKYTEIKNKWENWIPSYQLLHHPWVLKILSHKIIEKEIGLKHLCYTLVLTEEYTISLGQILHSMMTLSPPTLRKIKSCSRFTNADCEQTIMLTRVKSEEKIIGEKKFKENTILKMMFMVIDALIYCYEKGFMIVISESSILYCNKSDRFLISPFALVEDKDPLSVFALDIVFQNPQETKKTKKKNQEGQDQDEDVHFQKDLLIKKQIFHLGVIALKMASLKEVLPKNPKDIKKNLSEIKADFPGLYSFLNMVLYEIFRDNFDLGRLVSHPLYDSVYSKFSYKDIVKLRNSKEASKNAIQFGKTYNLFENSEASLQSFQKVMSDLTSKKQMSLKDEIEYSEVLKFTAEGYLKNNFVDQAKLYLNKCLDVLDKISITSKFVNLSELYCEVSRLCLQAADPNLAILVLEKASKNYFENHELENQSTSEIQIWQEIELKLYDLKIKNGESSLIIPNLERLAQLTSKLQDAKTALEYRTNLAKLYEKDPLNYSPDLENNIWEIGELNMKLFEYDEALKAHEKCLLLKLKKPDENRDSIIKSFIRIGQVFEFRFEYGKALNAYQKSFDLLQEAGMLGSGKDLQIMESLARCYENFGDLDGTLKWLEEIVSILDQNMAEHNGDYVSKIYEIARVLELQRNYSEAFRYYQKCVEIIAKNHLNETELFTHSNKGIVRITNFLQSSMI